MFKLFMRTFILGLILFHASVCFAERVKVGAILPLSGPVAPWGERVRIGLDTANELHGNQFEITYEDEGACEARKALTAYRKLVSLDKVRIIFLGCLAGTEAIVPVAAKDPVLLLSLGLLNESTLAAGAKLVNLATEIGTESKYLAKYLAQEQSQNIAGIFSSDAFGQEFARVLANLLQDYRKVFVSRDEADAQTQSFKSLITRWKGLKVDLLVTSLSDQQQLTLLKEMSALAFKPKIFSTYVLESFAPSPADRQFFEGIKYTHPVNIAEQSKETRALERELAKKERPGQRSNVNAFFAYDGLDLLKQGLTNCNGVEANCLFEYFTELGKQLGVSGQMRFEASGALTRPYGLKIVQNGEFTWLNRSEL